MFLDGFAYVIQSTTVMQSVLKSKVREEQQDREILKTEPQNESPSRNLDSGEIFDKKYMTEVRKDSKLQITLKPSQPIKTEVLRSLQLSDVKQRLSELNNERASLSGQQRELSQKLVRQRSTVTERLEQMKQQNIPIRIKRVTAKDLD